MMPKEPMRGATLFSHANKMTKAYHVMLTPLCKEAGLPPLALDILLFLANNPEHNTAKDICRMRGHKSGIVSVHVERLVNDGLLERQEMPGDRRQTRLVCTEKAQDIITRGRDIQWQFGFRLMEGISKEDHETMHRCFERIDANLDEIC
ncbi:MAG: MarR family winged helix-turn-helix transcriptional regulator, partial [Clostridiales bacterium]